MVAGLEYIDADGAGTKKVAILWAFCIYMEALLTLAGVSFSCSFFGGVYICMLLGIGASRGAHMQAIFWIGRRVGFKPTWRKKRIYAYIISLKLAARGDV